MKYPKQAEELIQLLEEDQTAWREYAQAKLTADNQSNLAERHTLLRQGVRRRARKMLAILDAIGEPSLSNIGSDAAQAISILALHDSIGTLKHVLATFTASYARNPMDTYYQAIPSMTDWLRILERKPQCFGTIWLGLDKKEPFLPTVEGFENVDERRAAYGIEALRWPKSLAIPESDQPWLSRPLSELVMRDPTPSEYEEATHDFL